MLPQVRGGEARYDSEGNLMKYTWRVTPEKSADAFCCGVPNRDFALLVLCYTILYGVDASIFIGLVEANSATSGFQVLWGFFGAFCLWVYGIVYVSVRQYQVRPVSCGLKRLSGTKFRV